MGHPHGISSRHWSHQEIKCQVNGPENQDPISMQIYLNKQNGDKGRANARHIRKSHTLEMKKEPKACSRDDLELRKIFPTLHITQIRPGCLVQAGSKSFSEKTGSRRKIASEWWHFSLPSPRRQVVWQSQQQRHTAELPSLQY